MAAALRAKGKPANGGVSDSLIRIEIITHFHRNPGLVSTPSDIAVATGRELYRVEDQIKKLVQLQILVEKPCNGQCRYVYVPPHSVAAYLLRKNGK